jgi:hypothetical protein
MASWLDIGEESLASGGVLGAFPIVRRISANGFHLIIDCLIDKNFIKLIVLDRVLIAVNRLLFPSLAIRVSLQNHSDLVLHQSVLVRLLVFDQ